ncbi:MAG: hypothetical protein ACI84R_002455, partial [Candidatus Azotimanducaceae bacterium]
MSRSLPVHARCSEGLELSFIRYAANNVPPHSAAFAPHHTCEV